MNSQFVYENDTLRLVYSFWAKDGVMGFTIENKLNIPLYIDWRKSAYISDDIKTSYWKETQTTVANTEYASVGYSGSASYNNGNGGVNSGSGSVSRGKSSTEAISIKDERISFIPPHTKTVKRSFALMPEQYIIMDNIKRTQFTEKIKAKVTEESSAKSPLVFSSFLTYSTKETFDSESYVMNEFYISKIVELPYRFLEEMSAHSRFYVEYLPK